jgi:hypothetical protein
LEAEVVREGVSNQQAVNLENQPIDKDAYVYALGENGEAISTEVLTAVEVEAIFSEELIAELQNSFIVEITDSAEVGEISEMLFPDLLLPAGQEVLEIVVIYTDVDIVSVSWGCAKHCGLISNTPEEFEKCLANCKSKGGSKFNIYIDW